DGAGEAGLGIDVAGMHRGMARREQNVVESEGGGRAEGSHLESYSRGPRSSTGGSFLGSSFFSGFFRTSLTAARPAAARPSRNRPPFSPPSTVAFMMVWGTRPTPTGS